MGLLGDLALGALNSLLSEKTSSERSGENTGVIFDPDGLDFPFHLTELRMKIENTLLERSADALDVTLEKFNNDINWRLYITNAADGEVIEAFVVTNGNTAIMHGLFGMGKCGLVVTGENAEEILQQMISVIQNLGFAPIELCDDQIPFHKRDWLWNTKSQLEEKIHAQIESENKAAAQAEKNAKREAVGKEDMLKTLVFMLGNNIPFDRNRKKAISAALSDIYEEKISLFSIEEKIDKNYALIESGKLKQFFSSISSIHSDREQALAIYLVIILLYTEIEDKDTYLSAYTYNLALIKRFFKMSRSELTECYDALAKKWEKDVDDVADEFETLTSEDSIKQIEAENPTFIREEPKEKVKEEASVPTVAKSPKEEIENLYSAIVQGSEESFTSRFMLADNNPKKVIAAVKAYAKNCKGEEILVIYDDSAFGNGKVGFLLSNKKFYICNSFEKPQEIELSAVHSVSATPKSMNSFITVNDIKIDMTMVNGSAAELIAEFLQKAIPLAKQIEAQSE